MLTEKDIAVKVASFCKRMRKNKGSSPWKAACNTKSSKKEVTGSLLFLISF